MQIARRAGQRAPKKKAVPSKELSHAAVLQQRLERWRKDRAAARPLRAAFPAVAQLRVNLQFQNSTLTSPAPQLHVLFPPAAAFFEFRCPMVDCDGQFDLSSAVDAALVSSTQSAQGTVRCQGHRARGHAADHVCDLRLDYTVTADCQRVA